MSNIIAPIISFIETWATKVPLELFAFLGPLIEEIIAPIPSPLVMTLTGSIMSAQNKPLIYMLLITVLAAAGRVLGSLILYYAGDLAEDIIIGKFGKFIGINHEYVEKIGKSFSGTSKDILTLTFLRSVPVIPSSPISVASGIIKLKLRTYILGTFFGSMVRNLFYLYLGYTGLSASKSLAEGMDNAETVMKFVVLFGGAVLFVWLYRKRSQGDITSWTKKTATNGQQNLEESSESEKNESKKNDLDYTDVPELPKTESDTKPTVYIFRHGQTEDNANYIFSGWRDPQLTETGRKQAQVLAEKLKDKKIDMLIASPQTRAVDTMKIAISLNELNERARDLEIHTDERIKERSYGDLQGTSKQEYKERDPEGLERIRRSFDNPPPNGESIKMVCERVADFCEWLVPMMKEKQINVAISCHGNSIRGFRRYFEGLDDETTATVETPLGQDYAAYVIE